MENQQTVQESLKEKQNKIVELFGGVLTPDVETEIYNVIKTMPDKLVAKAILKGLVENLEEDVDPNDPNLIAKNLDETQFVEACMELLSLSRKGLRNIKELIKTLENEVNRH